MQTESVGKGETIILSYGVTFGKTGYCLVQWKIEKGHTNLRLCHKENKKPGVYVS